MQLTINIKLKAYRKLCMFVGTQWFIVFKMNIAPYLGKGGLNLIFHQQPLSAANWIIQMLNKKYKIN